MDTYTALEHRPGDSPHLFNLDGGSVTTTADGRVVRLTGSQKLVLLPFVPMEPGKVYAFRAVFRRAVNSPDPSDDAVRVSIDWHRADRTYLGTAVIETRDDVSVSDGRIEITRLIYAGVSSPPAGAVAVPADALYALPLVRTFGTGHATDVEVCSLVQLEEAERVRAEQVFTPDSGFEWPAPWIPYEVRVRDADNVPAEGVASDDPAFEWPAEWIPDFPVARTIYVSQGGANGQDGRSLRRAVRSIERARDIAAADPSTPYNIRVYPGDYVTQGHIDFPDNVSGIVAASSARSTKVLPAAGFEERNVFRMGNGGYVQGFSFEGGWRVDDLENPSEGFAIAFRPGAIINRAVYAHNIVMYRTTQPELIPPPLDRAAGNPLVGRGGGVAIADGSVVSQYSVFPQIMLWGATPVNPNGIGYLAKNGGFINGINAVALWSHKQYMCLNGGEMILTNCASQFGDYTLWSEGSRQVVVPQRTAGPITVETAASAVIVAQTASIINALWSAMVSNGYGSVDQDLTRKDAGILLRAIAFDLAAGQEESTRIFADGMFDWNGQRVFPSGQLPAFTFAFENIKAQINALGIAASAKAMALGLIDALIGTVTSPVRGRRPSAITAVGHQWNQIMAGVNGRALFRPAFEVPDSVVERSLGTVVYSGIDDRGKLYFTGGALVNPVTGQLEGPPIDRTIQPRARRAALIVGGQI